MKKKRRNLLTVISTLSNKKELERAKEAHRKVEKDRLGLFLEIIEHRIGHVQTIVDWFTITDEAAEKELFDWCDTKKEIFDFLKQNFSGAEASYFGATADMHRTPIDDSDKLPLKRKEQRQWLIDDMVHHSKQLRALIEKKM